MLSMRESISLIETIGEKLFLSKSNLYFFILSKGMQVEFSESFHNGQVPDFEDVFLVRAMMANDGFYLAQ